MKFTIERDALRAALAAVSSGIAGKSTLPILANVLITAVDGKIGFNTTDLDVAVSVAAPGEVQEAGDITLPAKRLQEIAKQAPEGVVRFAAAADKVTVETGKARFKLLGLPSSEFPSFPVVNFTGKAAPITGATLSLLIEQVAFCASSVPSRPVLSGVLWELRPDRLTMIATTGHRLAKLDVPTTGAASADVIVPTKTLDLVRKLFADDAAVEVAQNGSHIGFRSGDTFVLSRLIEGPYPNARQVLPKNNDRALTVDTAALLAALKRVAIVASEQSRTTTLTSAEKSIRLATQTPDKGEAAETVAAIWEGDAITIGFNADYLIEMLKRVPTDSVRMTFKSPERAMTMEPVAWKSAAEWLGIIMPLRVAA
jgi:DNA polymerase III subunit beta